MIRTAGSGWQDVVLVCGKCSRKLGGGFGRNGDRPLAKVMRKALGLKGRKARAGVAETKCLGVCPKRAVMVVDGARPDRWLVVPFATPVADVIARLSIGEPERDDEAAFHLPAEPARQA